MPDVEAVHWSSTNQPHEKERMIACSCRTSSARHQENMRSRSWGAAEELHSSITAAPYAGFKGAIIFSRR
jgi:hypothetical protein